MDFEWDPEKATGNLDKHGVSFDEAAGAFEDSLSVTISDPLHSDEEARFILMGYSHRGRLLVIVHIDRDERIRLVSARAATARERRQHEGHG
jgi:hypothetical protein